MPVADSPARELRHDVGRAQADESRNAWLHAGQPGAMARDARRDALAARRLASTSVCAARDDRRRLRLLLLRRERRGAASRSALRSRSGRHPAGTRPGNSSAGTARCRRETPPAGCRDSRQACRRCAGSSRCCVPCPLWPWQVTQPWTRASIESRSLNAGTASFCAQSKPHAVTASRAAKDLKMAVGLRRFTWSMHLASASI